MKDTCPICGNLLIPVRGKGDILLVGEFPGEEEVMQNTPWVGKAGDVLRKELARVGISVDACRSTNLWLHEMPAKKADQMPELDFHFKRLLEQIQTAKFILMMGSELSPLFFGRGVSFVNGTRQTSSFIPRTAIAVAAYNPAICLQENGVVGDFRFACETFAEYVKGRKK